MLSQRDSGRGGEGAGLELGRVRGRILGATGLWEVMDGCGEGREQTKGFREQRPVGWDGGPKKGNQRGNWGSTCQTGGSTSQEMP